MALFTCVGAKHKKHPTFLVDSLETASGEIIEFRRPSRKKAVQIDVPLNPEREAALYKATHTVLQSMIHRVPHNCASYAYALAGVPIGDIADDPPSKEWSFDGPVAVHKLADFDTGLFMYRGLDPSLQPNGLGHWHTILSRVDGLSLHVDGGGQPIRISPTRSLIATYPEEQFDHYCASPAARMASSS